MGEGGLIELQGLTKHFRVRPQGSGLAGAAKSLLSRRRQLVRAVDGLDLRVDAGERIGLLGPNGAGKSTTVKMLTGILVPTAGRARVAGFVPWRDRKRYTRHIGVVFGQRSNLWWDLPVRDSFEILRHVYDLSRERYRENLRRFDELLELSAFDHRPVRQISLGQRMRADLAAALLHDPDILFLDEPTIGLDVVARERIRGFLHQVNRERGVTVLLTTHDMGDVERLCRRVVVIARGRALFDGELDRLRRRFGGHRELVVDFEQVEDASDVALHGARIVAREGPRVTYRFAREEASASELIARLVARHRIADLTVREPDIESVVRRFYEEGSPEAGGS